jgi:hypothetical protein
VTSRRLQHLARDHRKKDEVVEVLHLTVLALCKNNPKKERGKSLVDPKQEWKEEVPEQ